ncbi:DMT family transporter [Bombella mellum]|nr:DMT family transporter [Bombella mellum]
MSELRLPLPSRQEIALGIITILWGGTYYIIQMALKTSGPLFFIGVRFLIAALFVICFVGRRHIMQGIPRSEIWRGGLIGVVLAFGYICQTVGLMTITSSRSAFLTALYVPLVPLLQWIILRKAPSRSGIAGIFLAFIGLILLAEPWKTGLTMSTGDGLTLLGTFSYAFEIICVGLFALQTDSRRMAFVQLVAGGLFAFCAMPVMGEHVPPFSWGWLGCALVMGIVSAATQLVLNWAQKTVSPTKATIIYSSEPIWGGLVGWFTGDVLTMTTLVGAGFIVAGVLASEVKPRWPRFRRTLRGGAVRETPAERKRRRRPSMSDLVIRNSMDD